MSEAGDSICVLHVDDELEFTDLSAIALEREHDRFDVKAAATPSDGLELLETAAIDCVVSDYDMPGQNGIEFLETVRETYPDLPFILFTGKGSEEVASEAITAGVTDYLQKGAGLDQYTVLANRITNAVESYRSQRALAAQNHELRGYERMIHSMQEAACVYDKNGRFDIVNEYLADWYGTTREALEGEHSSLVPHIREEADGDPYQELLDGERETIQGEAEAEFPRHGYAVLEYQLTPLTVDGDVEGVVGVARDITERKQREENLERTNALLSTLFDALPQGVIAEDESRKVLAINQQLFDLFELSGSPAEVTGTDCEQIAKDVSHLFIESIQFTERIDELVGAREPVANEELSLEDGRTLERSYRPIELADGDGHLWVYRDVTERKGHERRLEALNQASTRLFSAETGEDVADVGVEVAKDVLDLQANAIHLYDAEESGLKPVAITDAVRDLIEEVPTFTGSDSIAWRVYEDGSPRAVDDVRDDPDTYNDDTPFRGELYLPIGEEGILVAGSTEPAAFDQEDILLGEILAGNIATALEQVERTEQLRAREEELTHQNERLEQFANIVSHDLRNPLNVAELRLEMVSEECDSEHLETVADAHDRIGALVEDLLTLARHGDTVTDWTLVDLGELVEGCWANVETGGVTLDVDIDRTIRADESRLKQLFENLIRNVVEHSSTNPQSQAPEDAVEHSSTNPRSYTREDAVEHSSTSPQSQAPEDAVEDSDSNVTVTVGELPDGFYVEDNGPGIPEDKREQVFEPGYSTSESGTGFGLSIVRQVVEAHGWEIRITESDDGGARFEITGVEFDD